MSSQRSYVFVVYGRPGYCGEFACFMKLNPHSFIAVVMIIVASGLCNAPDSYADDTSPMFAGVTLDIHGQTFTWQSASENGTRHHDVYSGPGGSVTVTGMIGFPDLATVEGTGVDVAGHLNQGVYADNYAEWSESGSWEFNGWGYDSMWGSIQYYPDLASGQLPFTSSEWYGYTDTASYSSTYYSRWWDDNGNTAPRMSTLCLARFSIGRRDRGGRAETAPPPKAGRAGRRSMPAPRMDR